MDSRQRADLDRHITGNYGEDQFPIIRHIPIANKDHSDAWITCSCGWGSFGNDGEEWLAHVQAETEPDICPPEEI